MKRYVVVSTNNNPDYYFYAKYLEKAWNKLGWNLCVMYTHDVDTDILELSNEGTVLVKLPLIDGVRTETIAQAGRLYAANYLPLNSLIMTSDMDLLPLSDYWNPSIDDITVYGYDLTGYTQYPMGYIAMSGERWKQVMRLTGDFNDMVRDINDYSDITFSKDWEKWWGYDQTLITNNLKNHQVKSIERGKQNNGFALGRIDRGNGMQLISGDLIDAHCENNNVRHPEKLNKFINLFNSIYGEL